MTKLFVLIDDYCLDRHTVTSHDGKFTQFHSRIKVSISPTFYEQLFALLVSACVKAARRTLMKLNHGYPQLLHTQIPKAQKAA